MNEVEIESIVRASGRVVEGCRQQKRELRFALRPHLHSTILYCHEQLISRAIENLLTNALKYTPAGGKIEVTITSYMPLKNGGIVEISVKDTGIGILEEDLERIFEPFYRGQNALAETGVGLGLSFVKEVVD